MDKATADRLSKELKLHAHAIGLPAGSAESFIKEALISTKKHLKGKSTITDADLTRIIVKSLQKLNPDLAYVYQNHDKII